MSKIVGVKTMHSILSTLSCPSLLAERYHIRLKLFLQYLCPYIFSSNQMVNTGSTSSGSGQQGQNNQGTGMPMPPPLTPEQFFQLQMHMMAPPKQHCSGTAAGPRSAAASASTTTAAPRQACGVSEGSPADVLPHV